MDQNTAWNSFQQTGTIKDYLIYSQLRQMDERKRPREELDEDGRRGFGDRGEARG